MSARDLVAFEKRVLQDNFYLFVQDAWPHIDGDDFIDGMHVRAICDHLQAVKEGRIKRLLVNIPPGFAKSLLISVLYPAWVWTTMPEHKFLSTSFAFDLSARDSRKMRQLILSDWYQARWPIRLKGDQNEKANFENLKGGKRVVKAYNSLTGDRGNTVLVDDPHSVHMAWSEADRTAAVQTFKAAVPSRLHNRQRDSIIVVMQRLHEEDVSGFILDHPELGYDHLCIPQEYEGKGDPTSIGWVDPRTEPGELLCPALISRDKLEEEKASLGPVDYAGQHQQRPTPRDAGEIDPKMIERFPLYIRGPGGTRVQGWPKGCNYYMTSDHAVSGTGDFNVFRIWAIDSQRHVWLVDSFREKCTLDEALGVEIVDGKFKIADRGAMALIRKWKPLRFFPEADNNWRAVEGFFTSAMRETGHFVRIDKITPHGKNKVMKAQPFVGLIQQGRVHLPDGKQGEQGYFGEVAIDEYRRFPNGKHDDQVDADAMIARVMDKLTAGHVVDEDPIDEPERGYGETGFKHQPSASETFFR